MSLIQQALLNAHGQVKRYGGQRWKLCCCEIGDRFFCDAENLDPMNVEEAKYCVMDIWWSESDRALVLLRKFAVAGGYSVAEFAV